MQIDLDTLRREVRTLKYVRGTPAEAAMWRVDDADSRANLAIEGMTMEPDDDAARRLVTPDEIMRMPADMLLLLRQSERPLWARKIRYYDQR